jgi:hypothetical protein
MLATIRLKKADPASESSHTQNHHKTPLKTQQQGFKVDLSDILTIKSRLKSRTATEQDKDSYSKIFKKD